MISLTVSDKKLFVGGLLASVAACATAAAFYFNIDNVDANESVSVAGNSSRNPASEDDFLTKGGDPLAQVTDKFYAHHKPTNFNQRQEFIAAVKLKEHGATDIEIKTIEEFPLEMISTAENIFEQRLTVYLKDEQKWSHWGAAKVR